MTMWTADNGMRYVRIMDRTYLMLQVAEDLWIDLLVDDDTGPHDIGRNPFIPDGFCEVVVLGNPCGAFAHDNEYWVPLDEWREIERCVLEEIRNMQAWCPRMNMVTAITLPTPLPCTPVTAWEIRRTWVDCDSDYEWLRHCQRIEWTPEQCAAIELVCTTPQALGCGHGVSPIPLGQE